MTDGFEAKVRYEPISTELADLFLRTRNIQNGHEPTFAGCLDFCTRVLGSSHPRHLQEKVWFELTQLRAKLLKQYDGR